MGKVIIPALVSPSTSSISLTISRMRFIRKANTAGTIAAAGFSTTTPPKIKTSPVKIATVIFPTSGIRFKYFEYKKSKRIETSTIAIAFSFNNDEIKTDAAINTK